MTLFFLVSISSVTLKVQRVEASATICIRADGSIDPPSAPISTIDKGTYIFTGNTSDSIVIERDNIVVDGRGHTVQGTGDVFSRGIDLTGRTNVTINNMNIKAFGHGIDLSDSSSNNIIGNNITDNNGDGIGLRSSSNNSVSGNNITDNDAGIYLNDYSNNNSASGNKLSNNRNGISLYSSSNNSISGNDITANNEYGIHLNHYSNNNNLSGNNLANNNFGIDFYSSSGNSVGGNTFFNCGLALQYSVRNIVVDNLVNGKPLVYLENVSDTTVEDAGQVILANCNRITVENLNLSHTAIGVELWQTNNTKISRNNITDNNGGIYLYYSSNNSITENNIATCKRNGIYLEHSIYNRIAGNNVTNNGYGVVLEFYSNNNTVSGNNITDNNHYGIELYSSCSENSVSRNNITDNNAYGIWIDFSSSNIVYHNNFTNNTQQVESYTSTNVWDDGYPSGGNYWIDYTGKDVNHDGIGDTPYIIDANNTDDYPLMTSYIIPEFSSFLPILLFMIATLLVVIVLQKKTRSKRVT